MTFEDETEISVLNQPTLRNIPEEGRLKLNIMKQTGRIGTCKSVNKTDDMLKISVPAQTIKNVTLNLYIYTYI